MKKYRRFQDVALALGIIVLGVMALCLVLPLLALAAADPLAGAGLAMAALPFGISIRRSPYGEEGGFEETVLRGVSKLQRSIEAHETALKAAGTDIMNMKASHNTLQTQVDQVKRSHIGRAASGGPVGEEFARFMAGIFCLAGIKQGRFSGGQLDIAEGVAKDIFGAEARTALTSTNIPLPVGYQGDVVELLSQYGSARRYGTVMPLGGGVVNMPRIKTSPDFGLIAASATVTEVSPETEWVTFTAQKFGGLVRLPSEIDQDSLFSIGAFLARYAARQIAKVEDHNFFVGTGANTGINGAVKGLCFSTIDNSKVVQMAGTNTAYSQSTLANFRALRSIVETPALGNGAYYMHPSFEQHLAAFNTSGNKPYEATGIKGATLDGFPVRWVDMMPAYSTSANASKVFALFGDLTFQYLGIQGGLRFDTSRDAGFTTDEILVRALERLTIGLMATGAVGGLETAGS